MTDTLLISLSEPTEDEALAMLTADSTHTDDGRGLTPGVYLSDPHGHAQLVGTNDRALIVEDLGGVIRVGGIDVESPDHLERFAARLTDLAARMRARATPCETCGLSARTGGIGWSLDHRDGCPGAANALPQPTEPKE